MTAAATQELCDQNHTQCECVTGRRGLLSGLALAVTAAALPLDLPPAAAATRSPPRTYWSGEYSAKKGDVTLALYRKRLHAPNAQLAPLPVLLLLHGSSVSGLPSWDLDVPGAGEYSAMNTFAALGYDVWVVDFEGYGKSTVTDGNSDIKTGVADLAAIAPVIMRETGVAKYHLMGESTGGLRAALFAQTYPSLVDRLVLGAFTYTGKGSPTLADRATQVEFYRTHNRRPRPPEMIQSIFTRDNRQETFDPRVPVAIAAAELPHGDTVPTGTYLDTTANLPIVDPTKIQCPVLLARGQYDGIATEEDILDFFRLLPNSDRQVSILPGLAHSLSWEIKRHLFWQTAHDFLKLPTSAT